MDTVRYSERRRSRTRYPIDCLNTLTREGSDQSDHRLVINLERFRMIGTACEAI